MKRRECIEKTIHTDGRISVRMFCPRDHDNQSSGYDLTPNGTILADTLTPTALSLIAEAYYAGYCEAAEDAGDAIGRLLLENSSPRKPKPIVKLFFDYRRKEPATHHLGE